VLVSLPDAFAMKAIVGSLARNAMFSLIAGLGPGLGAAGWVQVGSNLPVLLVAFSGLNGAESTDRFKVNSRMLYR
jgi:hypothetical protein